MPCDTREYCQPPTEKVPVCVAAFQVPEYGKFQSPPVFVQTPLTSTSADNFQVMLPWIAPDCPRLRPVVV
jgi:hypothetical protein